MFIVRLLIAIKKITGKLHSDMRNYNWCWPKVFSHKSRPSSFNRELINDILEKHRKMEGVIVEGDADGYRIIFEQDVAYNRPSTAAQLLKGGANNGYTSWKLVDTKKVIETVR